MLLLRRTILTVIVLISFLNIWDYYCGIDFPFNDKRNLEWDEKSYWYYPWGESTVHKGIDIFGDLKREILSPVSGVVIGNSYSGRGGNYIYLLSADLKVYYFAHLSKSNVHIGQIIKSRQLIGFMGDTGNAKYSPFHLHLSIFSIIPIFRHYDAQSVMGWKKMFYLNPFNYYD
ncbi:MAG: M23 family metallopeptidase [Pedobacter sp.]